MIFLSARMRELGRQAMDWRGEFLQALGQAFGSVKEARVLGRTGHFAERVDRAVRELAEINRTAVGNPRSASSPCNQVRAFAVQCTERIPPPEEATTTSLGFDPDGRALA